MRYLGYTQVSTSSQDAALQLDALVAAGVQKRDVFADMTSVSRSAIERPGMRKLRPFSDPTAIADKLAQRDAPSKKPHVWSGGVVRRSTAACARTPDWPKPVVTDAPRSPETLAPDEAQTRTASTGLAPTAVPLAPKAGVKLHLTPRWCDVN